MTRISSPLIMGKNCIREVLRTSPSRIAALYTLPACSEEDLYKECQKAGISIVHSNKNDLSELVNSTSHQSYVAKLKPRTFADIRAFLDASESKEYSMVVMLDSIYDPQNFGSILRAAECLGVDAVVYSKNRGADLTPVVGKVSSGASELVPLIRVSNLAESVELFKKHGFFVFSAHLDSESKSIYEVRFPEKTLIILGSEGEGVQPLLRKKSDETVQIPMMGQIDSLNVSQASAVLFFACRASWSRSELKP